ncbi:hypothetical protein VPARA_68500 [Variovorax paradoxus]|uniref:Uncharacterized protein n=1 Tax=Variovorax paradoxus TaxID=34073 RepID=A0A0H2LUA3_VARPD|nr:hypothetical protein VPARA_68500 [Variovorax paradoxus]
MGRPSFAPVRSEIAVTVGPSSSNLMLAPILSTFESLAVSPSPSVTVTVLVRVISVSAIVACWAAKLDDTPGPAWSISANCRKVTEPVALTARSKMVLPAVMAPAVAAVEPMTFPLTRYSLIETPSLVSPDAPPGVATPSAKAEAVVPAPSAP